MKIRLLVVQSDLKKKKSDTPLLQGAVAFLPPVHFYQFLVQ